MAAGGEPIVALAASRTRSRAEQAPRVHQWSGRVLAGEPDRRSCRRYRRAAAPRDAGADRGERSGHRTGGRSAGRGRHAVGRRSPYVRRQGTGCAEGARTEGVACGMLHPLQTIMTPEQGVSSLADATFGLVGRRRGDPEWADEIVEMVTGRAAARSLRIDADRLSYYHAGAVMASNALMAVLDAAMILLAHAGVERDDALRAIGPLARTSLQNALASGPQAALTGPVVRGDAATVAAHTRGAAERRSDGREAVRGGGDAPAAAGEAARACPTPACARVEEVLTVGRASDPAYGGRSNGIAADRAAKG